MKRFRAAARGAGGAATREDSLEMDFTGQLRGLRPSARLNLMGRVTAGSARMSGTSLPGSRVVRMLGEWAERGYPEAMQVDNGRVIRARRWTVGGSAWRCSFMSRQPVQNAFRKF